MNYHDVNGSGAVEPTTSAEPAASSPPPARRARRIIVPVVLFLLTIASTYWCGYSDGEYTDAAGKSHSPIENGLWYCGTLMTILLAHELGHFFQAVRYGVPASLPFFLPMPLPPIGTMGAVIAMRAHFGNRNSLFDIGISGPLAGLVPAVACCVWGIQHSGIVPAVADPNEFYLRVPLLFEWLMDWLRGPLEAGTAMEFHPVAFAGWVGLLVTSLNLLPVGQLDGGHILYALLRRFSGPIATLFLLGAIAATAFGFTSFAPFVILLCLMGPIHPPTADDTVPLGWPRIILGWLTLAFLPIGFTPSPFM